MKVNRFLPALMFLFIFQGCDFLFESEVVEEIPKACDPEILEGLVDIPQLEVDIPAEPRPWDTDVYVLRDSIANHDGRAMIGLKAPGSKRMRENDGIREALTAKQFEDALNMLCGKSVEILYVYRTFGAVSVRMDPDIVFDLFEHPMVDYIEIPMQFYLQS